MIYATVYTEQNKFKFGETCIQVQNIHKYKKMNNVIVINIYCKYSNMCSNIIEVIYRFFGYVRKYAPEENINSLFREILCVRKTRLTFVVVLYCAGLLLNEIVLYNLDYTYTVCVILRTLDVLSYISLIMLVYMRMKWNNYNSTICLGAHCFVLEFFIKTSVLLVPLLSELQTLNISNWEDVVYSDDPLDTLSSMYEHDVPLYAYIGTLFASFVPNLLITTLALQKLQYLTKTLHKQYQFPEESDVTIYSSLGEKYNNVRKILLLPYVISQIFIYAVVIQIISVYPRVGAVVPIVLIIMLIASIIYAVYWHKLKWYMILVLYIIWITPILYVCSKSEFVSKIYSYMTRLFTQSFIVSMLLQDMIMYILSPNNIEVESYMELQNNTIR